MKIRKAGLESLAVLTRMNKELREDEHIDNYMTDGELAERMRGFLYENSGYEAYLFIEGIRLLKKALNADRLDLEVLVWNTAAVEFYRSVGFKDRLIRMRME